MNYNMNDTTKKEKWMEDSDIIFTAVSTGSFKTFKQAQEAVVKFYVTDLSFERAGISHALKRLKKYYEEKTKELIKLTPVQNVILLLLELDDTDRKKVFNEFCMYCGDSDPESKCTCWRDK